MIVRTIALAASITALHTATAAQDVGGLYTVDCTRPTGESCSSTAEIEMTSEDICRIKWPNGSRGICMLKGSTFVYAGVGNQVLELGIYDVAADGTIEGKFIDDAGVGGTERMIPIR
jgi:hypothetical protein